MMTSMRTIIDLQAAQLEALDAICAREGISRAEAVRRAVSRYVEAVGAGRGESAFGIWRGRAVDGLDYERRLRDEWEAAPGGRRGRT